MEAFDDDRWRRNEIENEGWQILNFTARHIRHSPGRVVSQVRDALARRLPSV
jgi:very-short-patch-repair endonuclease